MKNMKFSRMNWIRCAKVAPRNTPFLNNSLLSPALYKRFLRHAVHVILNVSFRFFFLRKMLILQSNNSGHNG